MRDRGYPSEPRQFRDPGFEDAFDYIREVRNESEPPQKAARDIEHNLRTVEQTNVQPYLYDESLKKKVAESNYGDLKAAFLKAERIVGGE